MPLRLLISLFVLLLTAPAVQAQNPTAADFARFRAQTNVVRSGLGDDPGLPRGTPLVLPAGVSLAAPIRGVTDPGECAGEGQGTGVDVMVCLSLCNTGAGSKTVVLPGGLTVVAKSTGPYQNGLLVETIVVEVPPTPCGPGGIPLDKSAEELAEEGRPLARAGYPVLLGLYCLNESGQPSESNIPYALGPVTGDEALQDLLRRVGDKTLDERGTDVVQTAIYSITEGRGLGWNDEQALRGL